MQVFDDYFVKNAFSEGFSLYPILLRPKSRGKISLRSSDPQDYPKIQPNYLTHPDDVKVLIEGKITLKIAKVLRLFKIWWGKWGLDAV